MTYPSVNICPDCGGPAYPAEHPGPCRSRAAWPATSSTAPPQQSYPPPAQPQPQYPSAKPPPTAVCESYLDLIHEMDYDGDEGGCITGVVTREITDQDVAPMHNALGQILRWRDDTLKVVLTVPLLTTRAPGPHAVPGKLTGWLVHGPAINALYLAMIKAGVPKEDTRGGLPEAGAVISASWDNANGYLIGYTRPDAGSRQILAARQVVQEMSPIERQFWDAHTWLALPELKGLVPEYRTAGFRIDFALPELKIGIELDGFASHSSTKDIVRDRQRQRALEAAGWYIIRFGGSEVHHDAERCARQAATLVATRRGYS